MEQVRRITPEILANPIQEGIVSGGQTQAQIDATMKEIVEEHSEVFKGMGRAKVPPIHIQLKEGAIPVLQGKRPIPIQLRDATLKKLKELKENDLIEGPLPQPCRKPGNAGTWSQAALTLLAGSFSPN